jgi:dienelactone hydrolase
MDGALRLSGQREPLGLWRHRVGPPSSSPDLRAERVEFSSRGDRASGRFWMPRKPQGEVPLVLVQHGSGSNADGADAEAVAVALAGHGAAVAAIDWPLHGARGDAKLGERLARALSGAVGAAPPALVAEFARQAIVDLERAIDALGALPEVDGDRIGYVGFGLGARLGAAFASLDERVKAAALALPGDVSAASELDARHYVAKVAPRPVLIAHPEDGAGARAGRALYDAAGEPKLQLHVPASAPASDSALLEEIARFLAKPLGLRL